MAGPVGRGGRPNFEGMSRPQRALAVRRYNIDRVRTVGIPQARVRHEGIREAVEVNVRQAEEALPQEPSSWGNFWPGSDFRRGLNTSDQIMGGVLRELRGYDVNLARVGLHREEGLSYYSLIPPSVADHLLYQPTAAAVQNGARRHATGPEVFADPRTAAFSPEGEGGRRGVIPLVPEGGRRRVVVLQEDGQGGFVPVEPARRPAPAAQALVEFAPPRPVAPVFQPVQGRDWKLEVRGPREFVLDLTRIQADTMFAFSRMPQTLHGMHGIVVTDPTVAREVHAYMTVRPGVPEGGRMTTQVILDGRHENGVFWEGRRVSDTTPIHIPMTAADGLKGYMLHIGDAALKVELPYEAGAFEPSPPVRVVPASLHPETASPVKGMLTRAFSLPRRSPQGGLEREMDHGQRAASLDLTRQGDLRVAITSGWIQGQGALTLELPGDLVRMSSDGRIQSDVALKELARILSRRTPLFVERDRWTTLALTLRWLGEQAYQEQVAREYFGMVPQMEPIVNRSGLILIGSATSRETSVAGSTSAVDWNRYQQGVVGSFTYHALSSGREIPVSVLLPLPPGERFQPEGQIQDLWTRLGAQILAAEGSSAQLRNYPDQLLGRLGLRRG
ncbi:MAG: hypothetical protein A3F89_00635 [Deltaproteobacteria bacterium RIFCSPLOWO2_12_FULL_50_11]|nr:MAG: hypothetical protein A3F89_00635 [Deltaproteobacteria bacterium RIFCSPLOWO2_12_FULL_50_11]